MYSKPPHRFSLIAPLFKPSLITISKSFVFGVLLANLFISLAYARKAPQTKNPTNYKIRVETPSLLDLDRLLNEQWFQTSAHADTFILAQWTFDAGPGICTDEGWTSHDLTEQTGCYFHIDDFAGLGGGTFGRLTPLEGSQSVWCGARPDTASQILCRYAMLPGYGNKWDQSWCFKCIEVPDTEAVSISYLIAWDSEPDFDYTYLEYATKNTCDELSSIDIIPRSDWEEIASFDDVGEEQSRSDVIPAGHRGAIKIRFQFDSDGSWSDQDGLWDTDGAVIIDSITVGTAYTVYDFEDFEDEAPGDLATADGDWECSVMSGFGDFAGLFLGSALLQEDRCAKNLSCMWAFINGSTATYECGGHPEQIAVPYRNEHYQHIWNEIWSPLIDHTQGTGSIYELEFDVYSDLPRVGLMYYMWQIRSWNDGCPGTWRHRGYVYRGRSPPWRTFVAPVDDLIERSADAIQLTLACIDHCNIFWGLECTWYARCNSHAPLFDNVTIRRIDLHGPQFSAQDSELFCDTFPENGQTSGTGRIDMGRDITAYEDGQIIPGDSAIITVSEPSFGLKEPEPYTGFGSAVYFYLSRDPQSKPMPIEKIMEESFRWPVVDSVLCDGRKWYVFRCDTAFTETSGPRTGPVSKSFCIDVNDHFFTNGDTLWFFFGASDASNNTTYWSQSSGISTDISQACSAPMEMQILPGAGPARGGDILYVDNFSGSGAQPYFDSAFQLMGILDKVDRFDRRSSSNYYGNGLGHRVKNVQLQLIPNYKKIIWNSGDLSWGRGTVGNGAFDRSDDFAALYTFLEQHPDTSGIGIYFSGDNMAEDWDDLSGPSPAQFISKFIPYQLVSRDHTVNHGVSPIAVGTVGGLFDHGPPSSVDTIITYGGNGCPTFNHFDVIRPTGNSRLEMTYRGTGDPTDGAVISCDTTSALSNPVAVVLSGFSFQNIYDDRHTGIPDRVDHLTDIIRFLGNIQDDPTGADATPHYTNSLAQNYPNPFNPNTTIKYSIKERGHVTLKLYNVAGQLVRTLVDEKQRPPGEKSVVWDGRNEKGDVVSSGVYFYRLVAKNFVQTKKMVLLK